MTTEKIERSTKDQGFNSNKTIKLTSFAFLGLFSNLMISSLPCSLAKFSAVRPC